MPDRNIEDELQAALRRIEELEAAEQETRWHLNRLATIDDPLHKVLAGIWQQIRMAGLADSWGRYLLRNNQLHPPLTAGQLRPDLDPSQNEAFRAIAQPPYELDGQSLAAAVFHADAPVAITDIFGDEGLLYPETRSRYESLKAIMGPDVPVHSILAVPLRFAGERVGVLNVNRREVRPFSEEDIAAIQGYADQMALAVGNARMAEQLEERNRELAESLEQQTAMSEVLELISTTATTDIESVLRGLAGRAAGLLGAETASLTWWESEEVGFQVRFNTRQGETATDGRLPLTRTEWQALRILMAEAYVTRQPIQFQGGYDKFSERAPDAKTSGMFPGPWSRLIIPLLRDGEAIGAFALMRPGDEPYPARQVSLAESFAAQAVVAIENARLFSELQESNREVTEALQREETSSEILRQIGSAPEDLQGALDAIAEAAYRLCDAQGAAVWRIEGDDLVLRGTSRTSGTLMQSNGYGFRRHLPEISGGPSVLAITTRRPVRVDDLVARYPGFVDVNQHSALYVPVELDGEVVGTITAVRDTVRPFNDAETAVMETFARQAAIAIRNAVMLGDLRDSNREVTEALEREESTTAVLRQISRAPENLEDTLEAITQAVTRLMGASYSQWWSVSEGHLLPRPNRTLHPGEAYVSNLTGPRAEELRVPFDAGLPGGQAILSGHTITVDDMAELPAEGYGFVAALAASVGESIADFFRNTATRSTASVPVFGDSGPVGLLWVVRDEVRPFTAAEVSMLESYADQAAIAFENARRIADLRDSNREVTEALKREETSSEILRQIGSAPEDLQGALDAIAEAAYRLCDAGAASIWRLNGDDAIQVGWSNTTGSTAYLEISGQTVEASARGRVVKLSELPADSPSRIAISTRAACRTDDLREVYPEIATNTRSNLVVPIELDGEVVGLINAGRLSVQPFSDAETAVMETFARQAAIAIRNAVMLGDLRDSNREVTEALERQTATAEVLATIASAATDLDAVLNGLVAKAASLLKADGGGIIVTDGAEYVRQFVLNAAVDVAPIIGRHARQADHLELRRPVYRAMRERATVHFVGTREEYLAEYPDGPPGLLPGPLARLVVPLLREDNALGGIYVSRNSATPFSPADIATLETFADQAVIAIENARLFNELQESNREVTEALDQQTAMAEVLELISKSPTDLESVMRDLGRQAARLLRAERTITMWWPSEDDLYQVIFNPMPGQTALNGAFKRPRSYWDSAKIMGAVAWRERRPVQDAGTVAELWSRWPDSGYGGLPPELQLSLLNVPLVAGEQPIGAMQVTRLTLDAYSDKDIALLQTFAAHAVIAIENARLFNELQESNAGLTESLERQAAVATVLEAVGNAPTDLQTVFDRIVEATPRLFGGDSANLWLFDEHHARVAAAWAPDRIFLGPVLPLDQMPPNIRLASRERSPFQDQSDLASVDALDPITAARMRDRGWESISRLYAPLYSAEGEPLGVLRTSREGSDLYSDADLALADTFARQAVIAIENARLFRAQQEAVEQLTASAEVLEIVSKSPTDLTPVGDAIAERVTRLCGAVAAGVFLRNGDRLEFLGQHRTGGGRYLRSLQITDQAPIGRSIIERQTIQFTGTLDEFNARYPDTARNYQREADEGDDPQLPASAEAAAIVRHWLAVPLMSGDEAVGTILTNRNIPGGAAFSDRQVALVETFAAQAVIAIENARLFNELQESNREVTEALDQQTAMAEVLAIIASSKTDAQPVLDAIVTSVGRLLGANQSLLFGVEGDEATLLATQAPPIRDRIGQQWTISVAAYSPVRSVVSTGQSVHRSGDRDAWSDSPEMLSILDGLGIEQITTLLIPLKRQDEVFAVLGLRRYDGLPFTDAQVKLAETFAAQAVIAIENARLFNELQESNREVTEALDQQTAMAEVLNVIANSATDAHPVLQAIADRALKLTGASEVTLMLLDGDDTVVAAMSGQSQTSIHILGQRRPISGRLTGEVLRTGKYINFHGDTHELHRRFPSTFESSVPALRVSILVLPLLRDGRAIGILGLTGNPEQPISDGLASLMQTFAAQAVIAIENARLFNELQESNAGLTESLERQAAVATVLEAVGNAPTDLQTVFDRIVEAAPRLFGGFRSNLWVLDGDHMRVAAASDRERQLTTPPVLIGELTPNLALALQRRSPFQAQEVLASVEAVSPDTAARMRESGWEAMSILYAPMHVQDGEPLGVLRVSREGLEPYSDADLALADTFARQAVIAIENARLFRAQQEAVEQLTASTEVLQVIAASPTDMQPVLDFIVEKAALVCHGERSFLGLVDGDLLRSSAGYNLGSGTTRVGSVSTLSERRTMTAQVVRERRTVDFFGTVVELATEYPDGSFNLIAAGAEFVSFVTVPLLRAGDAIGLLQVYRTDGQRFNQKEIALLESFASQAVIAIENARLFHAQQEAVEQLTATAEVLQVIAASPTDMQPVLDIIVQKAALVCHADRAALGLVEGEVMRSSAGYNFADTSRIGTTFKLSEGRMANRAIREKRTIEMYGALADLEAEYPDGVRIVRENKRDFVSAVSVPLIRAGEAIGHIQVHRVDETRFSAKEIALLETFADQAVIAIENARLFRAQQEAVEQLTASADVLEIVSDYSADLEGVLQAVIEHAGRLADADRAIIFHVENGHVTPVAQAGSESLDLEHTLSRERLSDRAILESKTVQFSGTSAEFRAEYPASPIAADGEGTTRLAVPVRGQDGPIGSLVFVRDRIAAFDARVVALVETFADQAAIAIQNARLIREQKESNEQMAASADVLRIVSDFSAKLDDVLQAIVSRASQLIGAEGGEIYAIENGVIRGAATYGLSLVQSRLITSELTPKRLVDHAALERRSLQFSGSFEELSRIYPRAIMGPDPAGLITRLAVPIGVADDVLGVLVLGRPGRAEPFTDQQIALVESFADQAAIAIQNARLFREIEEKTREVEEASRHKSEFMANMSHELRTPLNAIIGYSEMLIEEAEDTGNEASIPDQEKILASAKHLLTLINDILDLSKIEAGRMTIFPEDFDIATLVREAEPIIRPLMDRNANTLVIDCPEDIGHMRSDQTKVRQALFNLLLERGQVHRPRDGHARGETRPVRRAVGHLRCHRHRHRHDRRADWPPVRGVLPGGRIDDAAVRRHRPRARHQPVVLPADGRRHHRRKHTRRGLNIHHRAPGRDP